MKSSTLFELSSISNGISISFKSFTKLSPSPTSNSQLENFCCFSASIPIKFWYIEL